MHTTVVNAATAQWLMRQVGEMGVAASGLLEGVTLDPDFAHVAESVLSLPDYSRLIRNALEMTGDEALGLHLGKKVTPAIFGAFGYALLSSRTLNDAAEVFLKYQDLPGQLSMISSAMDDQDMVISFRPLYPFEDKVLIYAMEEAMSTTYYGMNLLVNRDIELKEIRLTYQAPEHAGLYAEMFRCPIRFMDSENSMRLDAACFALPVSTADNDVYEYCTHFCDRILKARKNADPLVERIRNIIMTSLERYIKIEEMARELGLSIRSLNRRLEERGTSYKKIMNGVRTDLAIRYLEDTNLSIDQIAELIGFSETTAFRKAFKAWTGITPSRQRKIAAR